MTEPARAKPIPTSTAEGRVLVLAPTGADGSVLCATLSSAGIEALECESLDQLQGLVREGAGGTIIADEVLTRDGRRAVLAILEEQPGWSDLPLVLMATAGEEHGRALRLLREMDSPAHAILLERPIHTVTLVSAVRAALRSRARQYQVRDELTRMRHTEEALRASNRRLELALGAVEGGIYEYRIPPDRSAYVSEAWAGVLGYTPDELPPYDRFDRWLLDRLHPEDRDRTRGGYWRFIDGRDERYEDEFRLRHREGHWVWVHIFARAVERDPRGRARHVIGMMIDVTERRRAQEELDRYFTLSVELLGIGSVREDRFKRVNPSFSRILGYSEEEILARPFSDFIHPDDLERTQEARADLMHGEELVDFEHRVRCRDGSYRWIAWHTTPSPLDDTFYAAGRDVTEQRRETEALRELTETLDERVKERTAELERKTRQLGLLAHQLTQAEHRERKKLAATLHDGLQQLLLAAKLQLPVLESDERTERLGKVEALLDESMRMSRSLVHELSPPILEASDLPAAIEWLAGWFSENHRLDVFVDFAGELPPLEESSRIFLFNATRELLINAVKHSKADEAFVLVERTDPDWLRIEVMDEGVGFDPAILERQVERRGFGLFSIQERVRALGGVLKIVSEPGAGARFLIDLPLRSGAAPRVYAAGDRRVRTSDPAQAES